MNYGHARYGKNAWLEGVKTSFLLIEFVWLHFTIVIPLDASGLEEQLFEFIHRGRESIILSLHGCGYALRKGMLFPLDVIHSLFGVAHMLGELRCQLSEVRCCTVHMFLLCFLDFGYRCLQNCSRVFCCWNMSLMGPVNGLLGKACALTWSLISNSFAADLLADGAQGSI